MRQLLNGVLAQPKWLINSNSRLSGSQEVPIGQEIFFVVTLMKPLIYRLFFVNRSRAEFMKRVLRQELLFSVEPISRELEIAYPGDMGFVYILPNAIQVDMFIHCRRTGS